MLYICDMKQSQAVSDIIYIFMVTDCCLQFVVIIIMMVINTSVYYY